MCQRRCDPAACCCPGGCHLGPSRPQEYPHRQARPRLQPLWTRSHSDAGLASNTQASSLNTRTTICPPTPRLGLYTQRGSSMPLDLYEVLPSVAYLRFHSVSAVPATTPALALPGHAPRPVACLLGQQMKASKLSTLAMNPTAVSSQSSAARIYYGQEARSSRSTCVLVPAPSRPPSGSGARSFQPANQEKWC